VQSPKVPEAAGNRHFNRCADAEFDAKGGPGGVRGINYLLCMFNGFAFQTPLCEPIKA
jgi:hypothetical protein